MSNGHREAPRGRAALLSAHAAIVGLWCVGQVVRDRWWPVGLLFYVPSVCVALMCVPAIAVAALRRRRSAVGYVLIALLPASVFLCAELRLHPRHARPNGAVRVVHWNIDRGNRGIDGIIEALKAQDADVIVLSDLPRDLDRTALVDALMPGGYSVLMSEMLIVSRTELRHIARPVEGPEFTILAVTVALGAHEARLYAVDMHAGLALPRHPRLSRLVQEMHKEKPAIVVGDLNAPRRSAAIAHVPGYRHAYKAVGSGWPFTWPTKLPLWAIDQCLVSDLMEPVRYALVTSPFSDHRMQVVDLILSRESAP